MTSLPLSLSHCEGNTPTVIEASASVRERRNMAANTDVIKRDLASKYEPLKGMRFDGTYQGIFKMPQTSNRRDVIEVKRDNPVAATLKEISKYVLQKYRDTVWKGITGPEDSFHYTHYWLWVEPDVCGELEEELTYEFQIQEYSVFQCFGGSFSFGVSIKATRVAQ